MVALTTIGFLYLNFDPTLAGSEPVKKSNDLTRLASIVNTPKLTSLPAAATVPAPVALAKTSLKPQLEISKADRVAMLMNVVLLEQGRKRLTEATDYTCNFYKQERLGADLSDGQFIELKMRHKPFSVYMKWISGEKGRELLYVDGEHDNKMIVHPGGWKARLVPAIKLEPDGALAMRESRHPVTMVGLVKLCEEIITRRKVEIERSHPVRCQLIEQEIVNDRPCWCFVSVYLDRKVSEDYRKSVQFIDKEWLLPLCVKNYSWPEEKQKFADDNALDEATLIEHYAYSDLQFNQQLANEDFDKTNKAYGFRR